MKIKVNFINSDNQTPLEIGKDLWESKKALFESFYGDFYDFILSHGGKEDLLKNNINSKKDFYDFAKWNAGGMDSCYAMGFAFHDYFLDALEGGKLTGQSDNKFIGYLVKKGKYADFLNFLLTFFAWWRNDEGCTCFNPYNHADEFFNSNWAALVDTSKLFYLTSETVYHWQSFRVKYALDHIPGTILSDVKDVIEIKDGEELPRIRVSGYELLSYIDENGNTVTNATCEKIFALIKRKDTYNYWEKEEKTINKVYDPNYKKVDPA